MSLFDKAAVVFQPRGAAGTHHFGRAFSIKPEETVKPDELAVNGGFDTDTNWDKSDSSITIANGKAVFTSTSPFHHLSSAEPVFEIGKKYRVTLEISDFSMVGDTVTGLLVQESTNTTFSKNIDGSNLSINEDGKYSFVFTAIGDGSSMSKLRFKVNSIASPATNERVTCKIDNVSIKEVITEAIDFGVVRDADIHASRINSDGLVDKGRVNQLRYSNRFDVGSGSGGWTKNNSTVAATSNIGGRNGDSAGTSSAAYKLESTNSSAASIQQLTTTNVSPARVRTFSIYARAGNVNWIRLNLNNSGNVFFDLQNGAVGTVSSPAVMGHIQNIAGDWWRCSITNRTATNNNGPFVFIATADNTLSAASGNFVYIQDAQLEDGFERSDYIDVLAGNGSAGEINTQGGMGVRESEPRFDYTGNVGGDPGLLVESTRTNSIPFSEGEANMGGGATTTEVPNEINPTGFRGGVVQVSNILSGTIGDRFHTDEGAITPSENCTGSLFVKGTAGETVRYYIKRTSSTDGASGPGNFAGSDAQYLTLDGTWQRIEATMTALSVNTGARIFFGTNSATNMTANTVLVWGAQIEQGNFATSYIPTYGVAATRDRDVVRTAAIFPPSFSAPLGARPLGTISQYVPKFFTVFFDFSNYKNEIAGLVRFVFANDRFKSVFFYNQSVGYPGVENTPSEFFTEAISSGRNKFAISYDGTQYKIYKNGVLKHTDATVDTSKLGIGRIEWIYGDKGSALVNQVMVFGQALSDSECVSLTNP